MRISLITLGDPGRLTGGYLFHRRMAEAASAHGAEITFVSFPDVVFPLPAAAGVRVVARLRSARPDAVVIDSIAAAFVAAWLRLVPWPLAAIVHQPPGGIDHGPVRATLQAKLDTATYRRASVLMVASETLIDDLVRHGLPRERIVLVAPGRDVAAPAEGPVPDLRCGRRAALLCVGNWVERKGIVELLDAFAGLPEDAATLHLVGDDAADASYAQQVRTRLARPGLAERVVVHGPVSIEEVARLYAAADAFVLPSYREPYGTVYGEAMAAGLPVLGWEAGNLPHLARDGIEGFFVPPGNVAALTRVLETICIDDELRTRMGAAARARAEAFPTWDETAARFFSELARLTRRS